MFAAQRRHRARTRTRTVAICLVSIAAVTSDQLARWTVRAALPVGDHHRLAPGLSLTRTSNQGIAFGFFSGNGRLIAVLGAVTLVGLIAIAWPRISSSPAGLLGLVLLLAGALGNISERLLRASVTDYIDPLRWPAFNGADILISVGCAVVVWAVVRPPAQSDSLPRAGREPLPWDDLGRHPGGPHPR